MLFVSLDTSQHLLSTQCQIITDLQGGKTGGRWPVSLVMDFPQAQRSAGPNESASRGKYQRETEALAQQNHILFPFNSRALDKNLQRSPRQLELEAHVCLEAPKIMFPPLADSSAFGFPASLGHKVRRDTKLVEFFCPQDK